ncbi:DUF3850 domain-containing protein [Bacillus massiliglaciei]|uniref:DUF3850 domain-containing protein n=1 Tax=Bacillus massiliglaciei TaxID=1816693 RepID=UPI000DA60C03|nr:DUF3850 domain-containing protein [Bacillus massiliglaciei]
MSTHHLKVYPAYFKALSSREKTFEIRENSHDFKVGDWLILQEFIPEKEEYTGAELVRKITYISNFAQKSNFIVMAIA